MKRILNPGLLNSYIEKYNVKNILDDQILSHAQLHFYEKNEFILKAQCSLEYYFLLVEGKLRVTYPFENGKAMLLKFYRPFITVGDMELFKNLPVLCDIDAVEDTYLIAIPAEILRSKFFNNLRLLHHLLDSLSDKLFATINNSSYNFVYPLKNRVASYLVEYLSDSNRLQLKSTLTEIAEFLGTTYRHLNRTLKELEAEAVLRCENKTIYVLDEEKLRELAKNCFMKTL